MTAQVDQRAGDPVVFQRRTAYLVPEERIRALQEDSSIGVYRQLTLLARFPIQKVDRVVCNRKVDWTGGAIMLCLSNAVAISWVDGSGKALGDCLGRSTADADARDLLIRYLDLPDWEVRLDHWRRRVRMSVLVRFARAKQRQGVPLGGDEFEKFKRDFVYRAEAGALADSYGCWFDGFVASRLQRSGVPARLWGAGPREFNVARCFADLLSAEFSFMTGTFAASANSFRERSLFFETWREQADLRLVELVRSMLGHVAREIDRCP